MNNYKLKVPGVYASAFAACTPEVDHDWGIPRVAPTRSCATPTLCACRLIEEGDHISRRVSVFSTAGDRPQVI